MDTYIIVKADNVYGREVIYPVCKKAWAFAAIAGTQTLTDRTLAQIKALGFTVSVQPQVIANRELSNA